MFLNALDDVRDCSTDGHAFVGSRDVLANCSRRRRRGGERKGGGGRAAGDADGGDGGRDETVTVWCCVMTVYRVAVFSYQATSDGRVLLPDDHSGEEGEGAGAASASEDRNYDKDEDEDEDGKDMIRQWLDSQSVSIQFQAAHRAPDGPSSGRRWRRKMHHVFQMPLASIERVEKTLSSSQRAVGAGYGYAGSSINPPPSSTLSASSYSNPYVSGYSAMQQLLPSSSSSSSAAAASSSSANAINSAMVSFGSQMRPLLGGMASGAGIGIGGGSSGNFNLLSNGANNNGSSMAGMGLTMEPLGIILHGEFSSPCFSTFRL
jgi:hypothetical protein